MNLIEVENLKKVFGEEIKTHALSGASFKIKEGEFVAIMGPSGSGKSTLMHILGLLDRPSSGKYKFDDKDVSRLDDDELALLRNEKIGFVFQSFNLLQRTTVLKNVILPLIYSKDKSNKEERAKKVLESVGLSHRLDHFTNQISGGEKQRVAIARALVNNPSIIFADEPTGNLDSKSGAQIMEILEKLNSEGNTIILVTHETYTARCAKRIIHIKDGEIIKDEKISENKRICSGNLKK
ncbi:MAG: ABC transporter ATP-binding protein [Candidatus Pacebacteria bacterium]|nr:ABC transporter ATP-binding protein [Candidatus Paceibacterota bacterium]